MFQMTLNKHAKFHGDRTIGGAITVKKASKHSISKVNDLKSMQYYSLDSLDQGYSTKMYRGPVRENFLKQRSGKS